ncbi:hypothetical protein GQ600_3145 [Phytophthora cactorum]|nr:hypothetical protein GQ600_3145 [Phytophthora cactorum]
MATNPPPCPAASGPSCPPTTRLNLSPTTSSPVLLESPPRRHKRSARQIAASPYDHSRSAPRRRDQRASNLRVATTAEIRRGEEVTVDYGDDLWFIYRTPVGTCRQNLLLGKDKWKRLVATYNTSNRHSKAGHAPRIKKTNEIKMAIDERADVVEMDDGADTDQRLVEPDLCFDVDQTRVSTKTAMRIVRGSLPEASSVEEDSSESTRSSNRGEFQELLTASLDSEGLEAFARTPRPAPARSEPSARRPRSSCLPLSRKSPATPMASEVPQPANLPLVIDLASGSRDKLEELKYPNLQTFSNRLGGTNLTTFRDATSGVKRDSFAKAKRMRAMKTTSALISKLDMVKTSASNMRGRRMEELAARDAHRIAEKAKADERRRAENLEMEDRARRDREEARARTQELVMQIGALTKRDYDKRDGSQS